MQRQNRLAARIAPRHELILRGVLVAGIAVLVLSGCKSASVPADEPAAAPAATAAATSYAAAPTSGQAILRWIPPVETNTGAMLMDLAGYRVHYGSSSVILDRRLTIQDPGQTSVTIKRLGSGTWYFAVSAYTALGLESVKSKIVSKRI